MRYLENKHYFCATNYIVIIRMNKHILSFYLFFCLFLFPPLVEAIAGWNSFIVNFDKSVYGKGTQTWQIAPYDDKWVYFANKNGMVQFDGNVWNVFPLNNASDVRSVLASATQKEFMWGASMSSAIMNRMRTVLWPIIACPILWRVPFVFLETCGASMRLTISCISKETGAW